MSITDNHHIDRSSKYINDILSLMLKIKMFLHRLPFEILLHIISYVDDIDDIISLLQLNNQTINACVYEIKYLKDDTEFTLDIVSKFKYLEKFNGYIRIDDTKDIIQLSCLNRLKVFKVVVVRYGIVQFIDYVKHFIKNYRIGERDKFIGRDIIIKGEIGPVSRKYGSKCFQLRFKDGLLDIISDEYGLDKPLDMALILELFSEYAKDAMLTKFDSNIFKCLLFNGIYAGQLIRLLSNTPELEELVINQNGNQELNDLLTLLIPRVKNVTLG